MTTTKDLARPTSKHDRAAAPSGQVAELIDGLNEDLEGELQAVVMYLHYSATLTGPYRQELRNLFQSEITDELGHAQFLSDKIAALGGTPTTNPRPIPEARDAREMLLRVLDAEQQAIRDYKRRVEQAEQFGDVGLKVELENQISDETRHKELVERILAGWNG